MNQHPHGAKDLSILIPARKEIFLKRTILNALENIEADTEIIAVLDGEWIDPPVPQRDGVNLIYVNKAVGQRGGANLAASLSRARYVMKVDAHCSFDKGFDRKMIEGFKKVDGDVVMVPIMRNLWGFDWKCKECGWRTYQDTKPKKCKECGRSDRLYRKMIWKGKERPKSVSFRFDSEPHFHYFNKYKKRDEYKKMKEELGLTETMSLQGSCFMTTRDTYWKLKLCDEELGNWGNQGIEVACKAWLSGGKVFCNHSTWYAHMFRTHTGFAFPWGHSARDTQKTKSAVWEQTVNGNLPYQKYPVSWLIDKFYPVPGWSDEDIKKLKETETMP